ncbi:PE family protein, partial [Mycobacterium intermedium]
MSFVIVLHDSLPVAAADLTRICSTLNSANAAAAAQTTSVVAAASDEVSTAIAALFSGHAQSFQELSARAAA